LLVATPGTAFARSFLATAEGEATSRRSRLFPDDGTSVAHADLHNHTLLSDGAGRADEAFAMLRAAGMDAASLTDHAVFGSLVGDSTCDSCSALSGFDDVGWATHRQLADASDVPGEFTAIRGFEWTTPHLGHINVWFSENWIDSLMTGSLIDPDALLGQIGEGRGSVHDLLLQLKPLTDLVPATSRIDGFWDWFGRPSAGAGLGGGGADALCGLNHPNSYGNFNGFAYVGAVADRVVSCELLNARQDYLYRGVDEGQGSPLNRALNAGWRVGLLGVTDEHGQEFDVVEGKGRAGLWVGELTREGVREALSARRFYATRWAGLRVDATANGVRMGGSVPHRSGPITFQVDVDKGPSWYGKRLIAQVLTAAGDLDLPTVAGMREFRVARPDEPVVTFTVDVAADATPWVVLRLTDPEAPADALATGPFAEAGDAVAYVSPWWLAPDAVTAPPLAAPEVPSVPSAVSGSSGSSGSLPATGGVAWGTAAAGAASAALIARWLGRSPEPAPGHDHAHAHDHDHPHPA
jgi:hypothetical protein